MQVLFHEQIISVTQSHCIICVKKDINTARYFCSNVCDGSVCCSSKMGIASGAKICSNFHGEKKGEFTTKLLTDVNPSVV